MSFNNDKVKVRQWIGRLPTKIAIKIEICTTLFSSIFNVMLICRVVESSWYMLKKYLLTICFLGKLCFTKPLYQSSVLYHDPQELKTF